MLKDNLHMYAGLTVPDTTFSDMYVYRYREKDSVPFLMEKGHYLSFNAHYLMHYIQHTVY